MKIYTTTGDNGTTSLVGGTRVSKNSPRLCAYGTVDELNSWIGLIIATLDTPIEQTHTLQWIQNRLFDMGSALATEPTSRWQPNDPAQDTVTRLEHEIDTMDAELPRHDRFILPGGTIAAANSHIARTVARRAERLMIDMDRQGEAVNPQWLKFINRLSDYLFVLARYINHRAGVTESFWEP